MSTIKLPPLPDLPELQFINEGDEAPAYGWVHDHLRAWAKAYAEEAVRQALADVITPEPEKERIAELAATERDTGKDRLAFHIWALVRGLDITPNDSCGYVSPATLRAWMRWNPPC